MTKRPQIRIKGWQVGFEKIALTRLLQKTAGMSLREAKAVVDDVLEGRDVRFDAPVGVDVHDLVKAIQRLGAVCEGL
jgi:ribosomal protein L7/L12